MAMHNTYTDNYGDTIEVFTYPKVYVRIDNGGSGLPPEVSLDPDLARRVAADLLEAAEEAQEYLDEIGHVLDQHA